MSYSVLGFVRKSRFSMLLPSDGLLARWFGKVRDRLLTPSLENIKLFISVIELSSSGLTPTRVGSQS